MEVDGRTPHAILTLMQISTLKVGPSDLATDDISMDKQLIFDNDCQMTEDLPPI